MWISEFAPKIKLNPNITLWLQITLSLSLSGAVTDPSAHEGVGERSRTHISMRYWCLRNCCCGSSNGPVRERLHSVTSWRRLADSLERGGRENIHDRPRRTCFQGCYIETSSFVVRRLKRFCSFLGRLRLMIDHTWQTCKLVKVIQFNKLNSWATVDQFHLLHFDICTFSTLTLPYSQNTSNRFISSHFLCQSIICPFILYTVAFSFPLLHRDWFFASEFRQETLPCPSYAYHCSDGSRPWKRVWVLLLVTSLFDMRSYSCRHM